MFSSLQNFRTSPAQKIFRRFLWRMSTFQSLRRSIVFWLSIFSVCLSVSLFEVCLCCLFCLFVYFRNVCLDESYFVCVSILGMSVWMSLSVSLLKVCPSILSLKSFLDPCPRCLTLSAKKWKFKFHWQIQNWCSEDRQTSGMDAVCLISPSFSFRNKSPKVKIVSSFSLTMQVKQITLIFAIHLNMWLKIFNIKIVPIWLKTLC